MDEMLDVLFTTHKPEMKAGAKTDLLPKGIYLRLVGRDKWLGPCSGVVRRRGLRGWWSCLDVFLTPPACRPLESAPTSLFLTPSVVLVFLLSSIANGIVYGFRMRMGRNVRSEFEKDLTTNGPAHETGRVTICCMLLCTIVVGEGTHVV